MHFVETKVDQVIILTVKGNLVQKDETDKLQDKILGIMDQDRKFIVVDLKHVSMITSLGIGGLIRALRTVREKDGDLKLSAVNASVRKVFTITKLDEIIQIFKTSDEAVQDFD